MKEEIKSVCDKYTVDQLEEHIGYLKAIIEERKEPQPYKRWRAKEREHYYIDANDRVQLLAETIESKWGDIYHATGNYFKTEAEAETHKQRLLATQEMRDLAEGWVFDKAMANHTIEYKTDSDYFVVAEHSTLQGAGIYFETAEKAMQASIEVGKEKLKLIFNIEG